jgi:hypothetical protein
MFWYKEFNYYKEQQLFPLIKVKHNFCKIDSTHVSKDKKNKDLHKVISPKDLNEIKFNSYMHKVMWTLKEEAKWVEKVWSTYFWKMD